MIASGQWNNTKAFAQYQHYQRSERQSKITWNQVCVLARHKIWRFFFGKTLSTTDIVPACCYEKDLQIFPEKSELPKFIRPVKISWLIFSVVSRVEMKTLQGSEQANCLVSRLRCSISRSRLCLARYRYRFQPIKFVNLVVPSPCETQPYNKSEYMTYYISRLLKLSTMCESPLHWPCNSVDRVWGVSASCIFF